MNVKYDSAGDVLYLSVRRERGGRGIEDGDGIVWRYDRGGELMGATVIDCRERWSGDLRQLVRQLSRHFDVSAQEIECALPHGGINVSA